MKIAIATDHNGVEQKQEIIKLLEQDGYEMIDCSKNNNPVDDYPDFAYAVSKKVVDKEANYGVLLCGSGIGMSIAANKIKGIRCARVTNVDDAYITRVDNNANIIALSFKIPVEEIVLIIKKFIETEFSNEERHQRRIDKIKKIEDNNL